jgi:hypothetical protein
LRKVEPVVRDHRLVRGDQRLARRRAHVPRQRQRRSVGAADHLDDDVDVAGGDDRVHIVFPAIARQVDAAVLVAVARRHRDDLDRAAPRAARSTRGSPRAGLTTPPPTTPIPASATRSGGRGAVGAG